MAMATALMMAFLRGIGALLNIAAAMLLYGLIAVLLARGADGAPAEEPMPLSPIVPVVGGGLIY